MDIKNLIPTKLKFEDSILEKEYLEDFAGSLPNQSIFAISLAVILYLAFAYLDLYIVPDHVLYVWGIRITVVTLFLFSLAAIFSKYFYRYNQQILIFTALVCIGGLLVIFIPIAESSESRYYVGLTLVIPWLYVSLGLRTKNAFYINVLLLLSYNAIIFYFKNYPFYIFLNNNYFLVGLSISSFTGGYLIERNRRNFFQQTKVLTLLKEKAESANAAKTRFLAAASHDLRQPLHAMNLFLDVLGERSVDSEHSNLIFKIKRSSSALENLLESLLDISKLDANIINATKTPFKIQNLFNLLAAELKPIAIEKNISLHFSPTSLWIHSDQKLIERILRNLISNAIRYTEKGRILIGCRRKNNSVVIMVCDTGIGIEESKHEIIFEEFQQLHNSNRDRSKGLGLGLSIVKRLSELLKIKLSLLSNPGKGSVFSIEVPRSFENNTTKITNSSFLLDTHLKGKFIVIVEDEEEIRDALKHLLSDWGCNIIELTSINDVDKKMDRTQIPDMILADYRLYNHENGVNVIHAIYTYYGNNKIPAAIITGDTAPERIKEAHQSGFKIIHKPVSGGKLRALLNSLLLK